MKPDYFNLCIKFFTQFFCCSAPNYECIAGVQEVEDKNRVWKNLLFVNNYVYELNNVMWGLPGTITSVTRLASSWARTLDRLTLDCRDLERSEQLRRLRPQSLTQGMVQGLSEFGISLIGEFQLQRIKYQFKRIKFFNYTHTTLCLSIIQFMFFFMCFAFLFFVIF